VIETPDDVYHDDCAGNCVFCLKNDIIKQDQILFQGKHLYICAPEGQIVEGYLIIAPFDCVGCIAQLGKEWLAELEVLKRMVSGFFDALYRSSRPTFYEQGRAGGGAISDEIGNFPHHAHLCCLPVSVDLHGFLAQRYDACRVNRLSELAAVCNGRPYVYAEAVSVGDDCERRAYFGRSPKQRLELERLRLRPVITSLLGVPERGHWSAYKGHRERENVARRFAEYTMVNAAISTGSHGRITEPRGPS